MKGLKEARNNLILVIKEIEQILEILMEARQLSKKILITLNMGLMLSLLEKEEARKLNQPKI